MSISKTYENYSHDWWTPPEWIEWVKVLVGGEFFDPCPPEWNGEASGLDVPWYGHAYVNHPGAKGSTARWWTKAMTELKEGRIESLTWCMFNAEQERYMRPRIWEQSGHFVRPDDRTPFVWGGPDIAAKYDEDGKLKRKARLHGQPCKSPGNYTVFWTSRELVPTPPQPSQIVRTGLQMSYR